MLPVWQSNRNWTLRTGPAHADAVPALEGLWVPVITPFTADDRVDVAALQLLVARLLADGADGVVALGTTGEPATLRRSEKEEVLRATAEVCTEHRRSLMVGLGTNDTRTTLDELDWLDTVVTPAAVLLTVPYYTRPSRRGVLEHVRRAAGHCAAPTVVYNVPYRTGCSLDGEGLLELAEVPGVAGVKQAVGALDVDTLEVLRRRPESFTVLCGDDAFIAPITLLGGGGAIAAAAHLCTAAFVALVADARAGDAACAAAMASRLLPVVRAGFAEPNPVLWKAALHADGQLSSGAVRLPLMAGSAAGTSGLLAAWAEAGAARADTARADTARGEAARAGR